MELRLKRLLDALERALKVLLIVGCFALALGIGAFGLYFGGSTLGLVPFGDWASWVPWVLAGCFLVLGFAFFRFGRSLQSNDVNLRAWPTLFLFVQVFVLGTFFFLVQEGSKVAFGDTAERVFSFPGVPILLVLVMYRGWDRFTRRWPHRVPGASSPASPRSRPLTESRA